MFFTAEIGVNHGGSASRARRLIDAAKTAGATAVKFQVYDSAKLEPPGTRRDMLAKLQLSHDVLRALQEHARQSAIGFIATPFDLDALKFVVEELGVHTIKLGSGSLGDKEMLRAAAASNRKLILSTGGSTMFGVRDALKIVGDGATLLHCVSSYPAPINQLNLRAIEAMRRTFHCEVGWSDHTGRPEACIAAAALGATTIEAHITEDKNKSGPDHAASLEPTDFAYMIFAVRQVEQALGDGMKRPQPCEAAVLQTIAERKIWREQSATV